MAKYIIWDKQSDIYTPGVDSRGKGHWTAEEYMNEKAPWAKNPNVKVIVGSGPINGTVFMEFTATVDMYKKLGANIQDGMTDEEILAAIEEFENAPPAEPDGPTLDEREVGALEGIMMMLAPTVNEDDPDLL